MSRALVLGGGGPVGIAWQLGLAAGLADEGIELARAGRVIGTSAGAVVGAQLCSGRSARALFEEHHRLHREPEFATEPPSPSPEALGTMIQFFARRPATGYPEDTLMAEAGAFALRTPTFDEALFVERMGRLVPQDQPWDERFICTAIEADTGRFRVWDVNAGVPITRAVASSCSVPGFFPPVMVGGHAFIDGGIRSPLNVDLAAGSDHVLVLAVVMEPVAFLMMEMARREVAELGKGGAVLIGPDREALAAFGPNLMDGSRRPDVLEAGLRQGRAEAARLREAWG